MMDKSHTCQRANSTFLGRKRQNTSYFDNSIFRPLISSEPKDEYETLLLQYKNIFGLDWTEKFIRDNQQVMDNISPNALWFLYSSSFFPNDLTELAHIDLHSLQEVFAAMTKESECQNVKKCSLLRSKVNFCDDLCSVAKKENEHSLSFIEKNLSSMLIKVKSRNEAKIGKLQKMIPYTNQIEINEQFIRKNSILRDVSLTNDNLNKVNQYCEYLHSKTQKEMETFSKKEKLFDVSTEIKEIKDEDDWVCFICNNGDLDDNQLIYECESCAITVHQSCYGIKTDQVEHWKCDCCKELEKGNEVECILCSVKGGAMKKADLPSDSSFVKNILKIRNKDKDIPKYNSHFVIPFNDYNDIDRCWVHLSCALWNPNISFTNFEDKKGIKCIEMSDYNRFYEHCDICNKEGYGPTIKCNHPNCTFKAHPECARINKYHLEVVNDKGTLNYNIYCFEHKPLTLVKNIMRRNEQKEENIKEFSNLLKKIYKGYEKEYHRPFIEMKTQQKKEEKDKESKEDAIHLILSSNLNTRNSTSPSTNNTDSSSSNTSIKSITKPISSFLSDEREEFPMNINKHVFIDGFKDLIHKIASRYRITLFKNTDKSYSLCGKPSSARLISYKDTLSSSFPWEEMNYNRYTSQQLRKYYMKIIPDESTYKNIILPVEFTIKSNPVEHSYCYCKKKTIDEATMICCEKGRNCLGSYNGWFHIHCIEELKNLPTEEVENVKFICNECKGKQL